MTMIQCLIALVALMGLGSFGLLVWSIMAMGSYWSRWEEARGE